ncbi:serine/threonine protein kinase [Neiella sp. HB171785]|uniref:Serine/threonine protein kinase n=1 Tax=Neiella litorisoli TaxID=2771431 RepID=A0A8J6UQF6_9GAMM|nr:serine/threonine-protein kinase [Neiella litorisoli]MBD1391172.1 serine/threonine protein kinase [Neiella litorisoli]
MNTAWHRHDGSKVDCNHDHGVATLTTDSGQTRLTLSPKRKKRTRRENLTLVVLATALLLFVLAFVISSHIIEGVEESYEHRLTQQIDTHQNIIQRWYQAELTHVEFLADELALPTLFNRYLDSQREADLEAVHQLLKRYTESVSAIGYAIVDNSGKVVLSSHRAAKESQLTPRMTYFVHQTLEAGVHMSALENAKQLFPKIDLAVPVILVGIALEHNGQQHVAISVLDPETELTYLTEIFDKDDFTHSYIVNRDGVLISPMALAVPKTQQQRLDPDNDDLLFNLRLTRPNSEQLIKSVQAVSQQQSGVNVDGYEDFRGIEVMGAWAWEPALEIGLIIEVERDDAFNLMSPLVYSQYGLLALVCLAIAGLSVLRYRMSHMAQQIDDLSKLGNYRLQHKIGEGGMGSVYQAKHALLQRPTAVKLLRREQSSPENIQRFELEVQQTAMLRHPNTIEIYDFGITENGRFFYVMELLNGFSLADLIEQRGPQPEARVIHIIQQLCQSLDEAHRKGLIHRDIKPANIMLCQLGGQADFVKVLDFGLVKHIASEPDMALTQTQSIAGTAAYIAPERLSDPLAASVAVDIYSIGVVAYNLLTANSPFAADTPMEMVAKMLSEEPVKLSAHCDGAISPALEALIMACISRDPKQRPQDCQQLLQTLYQLSESTPWSAQTAASLWQQDANLLLPQQQSVDVTEELTR